MRHVSKLLITTGFALLVACQKPVVVHTVTWYETHDEARHAMLDFCKESPGEREDLPNCINASHAEAGRPWASTKGITPKPFNAKEFGLTR